jgi:hypothetical protein
VATVQTVRHFDRQGCVANHRHKCRDCDDAADYQTEKWNTLNFPGMRAYEIHGVESDGGVFRVVVVDCQDDDEALQIA